MKIHQDDIAIIEDFRKTHDPAMLGVLYEKYMHLVYGVCLKYLRDREKARDAVMDIFEKLPQSILRHEIHNFKSWLHVLTKNHCLMIIRSAKWKIEQKHEEISDVFMESAIDPHHENGEIIENNIQALKNCVETLQNEQKMCVRMFYLDERSYREIAESTRFELKKVKSYIQNGKRNLKICLEKHREA